MYKIYNTIVKYQNISSTLAGYLLTRAVSLSTRWKVSHKPIKKIGKIENFNLNF